ncbi:UAA transporter [Neoconidiobolus thromboides FSU 785]|nr:UAA transporter [Neoconidiobolus thromboides FSU 785]
MLDLLFCIGGIYGCFLTWGVLQERVSTTAYGLLNEKFNYFIFLNFIQATIACLVAFTYIKLTKRSIGTPSRELLAKVAQAAVTNALASPFGYASLKHIDYPTLVLGKSCKLVPVLLLNVILYRRKFPLYKYLTVFFVTLGVALFMYLEPNKKSSKVVSSSVYGLFLVFMNLLMDGVTNSTQDQIFIKHKLTSQQMMFYMQLFSAGLMFFWLINPYNPELSQALSFCSRNSQVWKDILLFSLCGSLGQCFIFYTLENYGSLVLVTVTVTRKLFTLLLSLFLYNHTLTFDRWCAVGLVFFGIGIETFARLK